MWERSDRGSKQQAKKQGICSLLNSPQDPPTKARRSSQGWLVVRERGGRGSEQWANREAGRIWAPRNEGERRREEGEREGRREGGREGEGERKRDGENRTDPLRKISINSSPFRTSD